MPGQAHSSRTDTILDKLEYLVAPKAQNTAIMAKATDNCGVGQFSRRFVNFNENQTVLAIPQKNRRARNLDRCDFHGGFLSKLIVEGNNPRTIRGLPMNAGNVVDIDASVIKSLEDVLTVDNLVNRKIHRQIFKCSVGLECSVGLAVSLQHCVTFRRRPLFINLDKTSGIRTPGSAESSAHEAHASSPIRCSTSFSIVLENSPISTLGSFSAIANNAQEAQKKSQALRYLLAKRRRSDPTIPTSPEGAGWLPLPTKWLGSKLCR